MKTTAAEALEIAPSLIPLDLEVIGAAIFIAYPALPGRMKEYRVRTYFIHKNPFTLKQDRILKEYRLERQYENNVLTPFREDWCTPGKFADPSVDL